MSLCVCVCVCVCVHDYPDIFIYKCFHFLFVHSIHFLGENLSFATWSEVNEH